MNNYLKENWFKIIAFVILIIGFGNNPYSYYQFERWAVLIIGGYSAYLAYKNKNVAWAWIFGIIAVLFNPIAPFYMARGTWQIFDLVAAVLFLIPTSKTKLVQNQNKIFIIILILIFIITPFSVSARSGCCSHHGGVCGCGCCDGTSLSATCAPYYPQCNRASDSGYTPPVNTVSSTNYKTLTDSNNLDNNQNTGDDSSAWWVLGIIGLSSYGIYRYLKSKNKQ